MEPTSDQYPNLLNIVRTSEISHVIVPFRTCDSLLTSKIFVLDKDLLDGVIFSPVFSDFGTITSNEAINVI
jgi:hypothetical protein